MSSLCYEVIFNMRWTYVFYTLAYGYVVCYDKKNKSLIVITTSWFAIALDEIRTRRILREKADCKQSTSPWTKLTVHDKEVSVLTL